MPVLDAAINGIAGQISELAAKVKMLEANQRSSYNGRNTVIDNGAIVINDATGAPAVVIGQQSDGTFAAKQVGTVVPPKAPSTPVVTPGIQGLYVAWDGLMNDGSTPQSDFSATQVHVSTSQNFTPSAATLVGHMVGAGLFGIGSLNPGTTYYVAFTAINGVGDTGPGSAQASGVPAAVPPGVIPNGSITALQIQTGTITAAQIAAAAGILGSQIATGTITSANILAGTITTALLAAGMVVAGIVDSTTITGSTLRNSATDPKTAINPDGSITITNSGGTVIFKIGPDGTVFWYSPGGTLLMSLQPGGNQLIYASLTGPSGWDFEPPSTPAVLFSASSAVSSTTYANAPTVNAVQGSTVTVIASASGATNATGVTDTQGNSYSQVQGVTSGVNMSVWQATNVSALTNHDTITVTFGAANTQEKNIIALATSGLVTTSVTDFSSQANGTSTAPSASGTPSFYGDAMLFIVSNASAGGAPSAITDGWTQIAQQNVSTFQWTTAWYSANISGASQSATATIVSAAWSAVMIGLKMSPLTPVSNGVPTGVAATLSASTAWANDGVISLKMTHVGTTTGWGATFPAFPVQPGTTASMAATIFTPTALTAISIGFTFWSGAGGTGTNLGTVSGDQGTLSTTTNGVYAVSISGASVPAGAQSATFFVSEGAADAANTVYYIDTIQVPGGLVYSNSPTGGVDSFGNTFEQGINFIGLPGLTNVFGVEDPFGNQLVSIDAQGNISGQTISATTDMLIGGQSVLSLIAPGPTGLINYGFKAIGGTAWPSTAIGTTEVALFEMDQAVKANRIYQFEMNQTIINANAIGSMHLHLRYTTDGSTPTTSSTEAMVTATRVDTTATDTLIGPLSCIFTPVADATYRFLVTGHAGSGTYQFKNDDYIRIQIYDWGLNSGVTNNNNLVVLGSGTSGSSGAQQKTEYFYGNATWTYYGPTPSLRGHNTTIYQGAYQGEGGYQYAYIQFSTGSLGNNLNTVLNFTVQQVQLRLLNQHSWYNSGMTVGLHSSTSLGGAQGVYSTLLDSWHINEGQQLAHTLGTSTWAPWKAGGTTYAVLAPDAANLHNLNWYGYFWGGGSNNANVPAMIVTYTH
jgi:hypothetical protein